MVYIIDKRFLIDPYALGSVSFGLRLRSKVTKDCKIPISVFSFENELNLSEIDFRLKIWTGKTNKRLIVINTLDP